MAQLIPILSLNYKSLKKKKKYILRSKAISEKDKCYEENKRVL